MILSRKPGIMKTVQQGFLCVYSAQKEKSKSFVQIQDKGFIAILEESSQKEDGEASWDKEPEMYQWFSGGTGS